jgi:hypothetical protein
MLYGFILIHLRDFAPGKEQWLADYAVGNISSLGSPMLMTICSR